MVCSSFAPTMADSLSSLNDLSWGDQVELSDVAVNDVAAAAAADAVSAPANGTNDAPVADAVPVNNADPLNDVRVNPDRVNAAHDAAAMLLKMRMFRQILRVETLPAEEPVRSLLTLVF